jgi:hypothetical protein
LGDLPQEHDLSVRFLPDDGAGRDRRLRKIAAGVS